MDIDQAEIEKAKLIMKLFYMVYPDFRNALNIASSFTWYGPYKMSKLISVGDIKYEIETNPPDEKEKIMLGFICKSLKNTAIGNEYATFEQPDLYTLDMLYDMLYKKSTH